MTGPEYSESQPFEPWLPTYEQVVYRYRNPSTNYPKYGWWGLEISPEKYPIIWSRRMEINDRFFERYAMRRLNQETILRWQLRLQNRFDEVAPEFERAFMLYEKYREQMDEDVFDGYKMVHDNNQTNSGSDININHVNRSDIDTPDKAINHDKNYADRVSDTNTVNTLEHGLKTNSKGTTDYQRTGVILQNINASISSYRDIDTEFVKCFENNFLNIFE